MSEAIAHIAAALTDKGLPVEAAPVALAAMIDFLERDVEHEAHKALMMGDVQAEKRDEIEELANAARVVANALSFDCEGGGEP